MGIGGRVLHFSSHTVLTPHVYTHACLGFESFLGVAKAALKTPFDGDDLLDRLCKPVVGKKILKPRSCTAMTITFPSEFLGNKILAVCESRLGF